MWIIRSLAQTGVKKFWFKGKYGPSSYKAEISCKNFLVRNDTLKGKNVISSSHPKCSVISLKRPHVLVFEKCTKDSSILQGPEAVRMAVGSLVWSAKLKGIGRAQQHPSTHEWQNQGPDSMDLPLQKSHPPFALIASLCPQLYSKEKSLFHRVT